MWPSTDPENAMPGNADTAADCAGLQRSRVPQSNGGVYQTFSPVCRFSAYIPPPRLVSASVNVEYVSMIRPMSELATYTFCASAAEPHCTPPIVPPCPTRVCQRISPLLSGS